jgi:hypothetical protein
MFQNKAHLSATFLYLPILLNRSMKKKGQVTVFIIVGIVLLLIVGLIFFQKGQDTTKSVFINKDLVSIPYSSSVQNFVQSCFEQVTELGVIRTGHQGGYWESPLDYSILFFDDTLPYYYADETSMVISEENAEHELENYIKERLPECVQDFSIYEDEGYEIIASSIDVNVNFGNQILVELQYPLTIQKGITVLELNDFVHILDVNMRKFFDVAHKIVEKHQETDGYICLTCIDEWASEEDVIITVFPIYDTGPFENDILWFTLWDKNNKEIRNRNFTFEFVLESIPRIDEEELEMEDIVSFDILSGVFFEYQIETNKDDVIFYDDTDLFDIDDKGLIQFIPSEDQQGSHFVEIEAEDKNGNTDSELLLLTIS